MFYVGIDIAKRNHEASIINFNGKLLDKSISFSNSQAGCAKLISYLKLTLPLNILLLEILSVDTDVLSKLLSEASRGRFGIAKASEIQNPATNTFGVSFAKDAFAFQIKQIIAQINFIKEQLEELETEISTILHRNNQVITTITGIGDARCHYYWRNR